MNKQEFLSVVKDIQKKHIQYESYDADFCGIDQKERYTNKERAGFNDVADRVNAALVMLAEKFEFDISFMQHLKLRIQLNRVIGYESYSDRDFYNNSEDGYVACLDAEDFYKCLQTIGVL